MNIIENHIQQTKSSFIWRLLHNFGSQIISLVVQIVMARLLLPEAYGIIALTAIFTSIGLVLIQGAFFPSIIQKKEINQTELSSIYYMGIIIALGVVGLIFIGSPLMADFYNEPLLKIILRVQSLNILIGSLFSVHQALLFRQMNYKKSFFAGITAIVLQGIVGIGLAVIGFEVWALIISQLIHTFILGLMVSYFIRWKASKTFSMLALKEMFTYSSRLFLVSLMNAFYVNLTSLFIGKIYDSKTLGYYQRGYSFPTLIMNNFDGAMNHVLFTSLSKIQDQVKERLSLLRRSMKISLFISAPMMLGLVVIAEPLVLVLLTDKWLPAVPFLQLTALGCLIWPLSARMQAINAIGRSDITLKLNILLRVIGVLLIIIFSKMNLYLLVISTIMSEVLIAFFTTFIVKRMIGYRVTDQIKDILPSMLLAVIMAAAIYPISFLELPRILILLLQGMSGFVLYIGLAFLFKLDTIYYLMGELKSLMKKLNVRKGDENVSS